MCAIHLLPDKGVRFPSGEWATRRTNGTAYRCWKEALRIGAKKKTGSTNVGALHKQHWEGVLRKASIEKNFARAQTGAAMTEVSGFYSR